MVLSIKKQGERKYLGNESTNEVHNLKNELAGCKIRQIFEAGKAVGFSPDTLGEAVKNGYGNKCVYCIGKF